jgi:hypothetical protein
MKPGSILSNLVFNFSQKEGHTLTKDDCELFKNAYKNWDAEITDKVSLPRNLTAENGAKALLIGEFFEKSKILCPECFDEIECVNCDTCNGTGEINSQTEVSWTTIKAIYDKIVEHYG